METISHINRKHNGNNKNEDSEIEWNNKWQITNTTKQNKQKQ